MRVSKRSALAVGAASALLLGALSVVAGQNTAAGSQATVTPAAGGSGGISVAYFDQWSIYQNAYYLRNLDTSGAAAKLNYLIYDFENIDPTNLTCFEANKASDSTNESDPNAGDGAGDSFADYQKSFDATTSVSGVADVFNQPIVGNFNQIKELKAKYPNLKVVASIGGWTYSKYFSDVAKTAASRQKFVSSCIDMFLNGNLPAQGGYGGPGTGAGVFDGFDLDWEYVGSPGGHTGNHFDPVNDGPNYTALLAEWRSELNTWGAAHGGVHPLLTAALPGGQDKIAKVQTNQIGQYLDYANIMTYDMHGGFEPTGPTNHQAPIYDNPADPMTAVAPDLLPSGTQDTTTLRVVARTQGDHGFLFFNNYVRNYSLPEHKGVQAVLKLPSETITVPRHPVTPSIYRLSRISIGRSTWTSVGRC